MPLDKSTDATAEICTRDTEKKALGEDPPYTDIVYVSLFIL
jgi:hypothetical protein